MPANEIIIKYIGGATALLEIGGLRILTDPTFDPKNTTYETAIYTLRRLTDPSIRVNKLGKIDVVLLSHDHHFDNLDNSGRELLASADKVLTTPAGAARLKGNATGLENWDTVELPTKDGRILLITGTPCRHGPPGGDRGPVTGFVLQLKDQSQGAVYITGDTVWYEGVEEVAKRFDVRTILLFMGAATVKAVGPAPLTMTVTESVEVARVFDKAEIIPLHFEGWEHFIEGKAEIEHKFKTAGLVHRLKWAEKLIYSE